VTEQVIAVDQTSCAFVHNAYASAMRAVADKAIALIEEQLVSQKYLNDNAWRYIDSDGRVELDFSISDMLNTDRNPEDQYVHTHSLIYQYMETHFLAKGFGTHYNKVHDTFTLTFGKITKELR
jgi:hypothetical protein